MIIGIIILVGGMGWDEGKKLNILIYGKYLNRS